MDYLSYDVYKQTKKGFEKLNTTPYTVIIDPNKPFQLIGTRTLALAVIKIGFEGELLISGFSENREYSNKGELVPCTAVDNDSITIDLNNIYGIREIQSFGCVRMRREGMSVRKRESAKKVVKVLDKVLKLEANSTSCLFVYEPKAPASLERYKKLK